MGRQLPDGVMKLTFVNGSVAEDCSHPIDVGKQLFNLCMDVMTMMVPAWGRHIYNCLYFLNTAVVHSNIYLQFRKVHHEKLASAFTVITLNLEYVHF